MQHLTVVTNHTGYAARRSFVELPLAHTTVRKTIDPFKLVDATLYRLTGQTSLLWHNLWWDWGQHDLVHLRNGISVGRSPWISSFEDYLPRWAIGRQRSVPDAFTRMAAPQCRALVAQCEAARARQLRVAREQAPHLVEAIERKLHVLLPPQPVLVEAYDKKPLPDDGLIHFAFVGHDFFRKGGREVLQVFDRMLEQGAPLYLTIVSKLEFGDYATRATAADAEEARALIARHPHRIMHHAGLPYPEVIDLHRRAHVGLLLTWSDTFGYSALEAQAAGCPVITTDVNAMPEINSSDVGWMVPVSHHPWKAHAAIGTEESRARVSAEIVRGLEETLSEIIAHPGQVASKGRAALQQVAARHDPVRAAEWTEHLYHHVVNQS